MLAQLPRATYYDRRHRRSKIDKYIDLKEFICQTFRDSHETYGYRRIHFLVQKEGYQVSPNTVFRLMVELKLSSTVYSRHTSGYHSYKGHIGTVNDNLINQRFHATRPFTVLHTDVTQVKLANNSWGYISAIMDEARRKIISIIITNHANREQLALTTDDFATKLLAGTTPIMHSDQGWQYQNAVKELNVTPSMSRKGNCHDNFPLKASSV